MSTTDSRGLTLHELRVRLNRMSMSSLKRRGSLRTECGWVTDEASEIELWTKSLKWTLSIHCADATTIRDILNEMRSTLWTFYYLTNVRYPCSFILHRWRYEMDHFARSIARFILDNQLEIESVIIVARLLLGPVRRGATIAHLARRLARSRAKTLCRSIRHHKDSTWLSQFWWRYRKKRG